MTLEELTKYARHRQVMECRIPRGDDGLAAVNLLPVALVPADAERDKPAHVLAISWIGNTTPRFEHVHDGELLPLDGQEHTPIDPEEKLPAPWWTHPAEQQTHKVHDTTTDKPSLVIARNVLTQLALMEAIAACAVLEVRVRFQYARGEADEWRDATFVGVGGKAGHLVYGLDHDRLKDGEPQLRSYAHGKIRGLVVALERIPRWDGQWSKAATT